MSTLHHPANIDGVGCTDSRCVTHDPTAVLTLLPQRNATLSPDSIALFTCAVHFQAPVLVVPNGTGSTSLIQPLAVGVRVEC